MRQLPFLLLCLALGLGGCASSPAPGTCGGRLSDFCPHPPQLEHRKALRRTVASYVGPSHRVAVLPKRPKEDIPEPRINNTAWWLEENARLRKAITICRGCLPSPVATVSPLKPGGLSANGSVPDVSTTSSLLDPGPKQVEQTNPN
jgi:hypothetical protein